MDIFNIISCFLFLGIITFRHYSIKVIILFIWLMLLDYVFVGTEQKNLLFYDFFSTGCICIILFLILSKIKEKKNTHKINDKKYFSLIIKIILVAGIGLEVFRRNKSLVMLINRDEKNILLAKDMLVSEEPIFYLITLIFIVLLILMLLFNKEKKV